MASSFDYEKVLREAPAPLEKVEATQMKSWVETVDEMLAEAPSVFGDNAQMLKDIKTLHDVIHQDAGNVASFIGKEGDVASETGTYWGAVTYAGEIKKAMGGDQ